MVKLPFMQFYPADWSQDTQVLSLAAKGAWITLLCQMWISPSRGVVKLSEEQCINLFGLTHVEDLPPIVHELMGVSDIDISKTEGKITHLQFTCRRMVRDEIQRNHDLERKKEWDRGHRGRPPKSDGNPTAIRQESDGNPTPIYQKSEVRSQNKTPVVPKGDNGFEEFWREYPRKVGKGAAVKAWEKIHPTNGMKELILAALKVQVGWDQWQKENGAYIPNPATWLNQRRWEDEGMAATEPERTGIWAKRLGET